MVHQYKNNGYNMVLDVASGSVHVVDDLTYEVIALYEDHTLEEIIKELSSWDEKDVRESYEEVTELKMQVYYLQKIVMKNTFADSKTDQQL